MIFVLGAKGFVGSAFVRHCRERGLECVAITRDNYGEWAGRGCDLLINAAGNSSKRLALTDPLADFDRNARESLRSLLDFAASRYVYLSSVDVYHDCVKPEHNAETTPILPALLSRYGLGKYICELLTQRYAADYVIVRLGGMVGPGLRKNAVYDVTHNGKVYVHPESAYQYLHTDWVAGMVMQLAQDQPSGEVFNVCGQGTIRPRQVSEWIGRSLSSPDLPLERYDINIAKVKSILPVPTSEDSVRRYLQEATPSRHTR